MVFYFNGDDVNHLQELKPSENVIQTMTQEVINFKDINIKDFNFYLFESDLENLSDGEFEYLFKTQFQDIIDYLEDEYLFLDFENLLTEFHTSVDKRFFFKKLVMFIMQLLPYEIFKPIVQNIKHTPELIPEKLQLNDTFGNNDWYNILDIDNPNIVNLKPIILNTINKKIAKLNNWVNMLGEFSNVSKKDTLADSKDILDKHVTVQNNYYSIYMEIITETDLEKILKLFRKYIDIDFLNIK